MVEPSELRSRRHRLQPRNWSLGSLRDRFDYVRPYLTGKSVLDVGCGVGHHRGDWMHSLIRGVAREIVGVDIDEAVVEKLRNDGNEVVFGDAQRLSLEKKFEVVFAGEIIEHLDNVQGFLDSARLHLEPGGILVLTTPNAFALSNFIYRLWGSVRVNPDHRCWFCEDTIGQLLRHNRFAVLEVRYVRHRTPGVIRRSLAFLIRSLLPDRLAWDTLLVVAKPQHV